MNEQFTRQAQDMFAAAKDARIPENLQAMAEEGVQKTREAYYKLNEAAKDGAKVVEEVMLASQAGAKAIGEKIVHNTSVNTEAAFDAAQAIARAKTLPELVRLQADYLQQQFAVAGAQSKELFELSAHVAKQTMETVNSAAAKSFEQMKKVG
ncbi:MAG: phasin family protein [Hyphomicrobiaceae bacterium]|nr:phasin family protein [Hyphomicrobiaceae bacterium]MCC0009351.1 phasin family protein [Hyphomicrobiaceae bacterium]